MDIIAILVIIVLGSIIVVTVAELILYLLDGGRRRKGDEEQDSLTRVVKDDDIVVYSDRENINETDSNKINELYECGLKRGFLTEDEPEFEPEETDDTFYDDDEPLCGGPDDSLTNQEFLDSPKTDDNIQTPIYTIFYTAIQNGEMKNGEYYSHITDKEEAKNDCILQLGNIGYSDVQIKAMEQTTQTAISDENTPKP
jgi:hypothetical protein